MSPKLTLLSLIAAIILNFSYCGVGSIIVTPETLIDPPLITVTSHTTPYHSTSLKSATFSGTCNEVVTAIKTSNPSALRSSSVACETEGTWSATVRLNAGESQVDLYAENSAGTASTVSTYWFESTATHVAWIQNDGSQDHVYHRFHNGSDWTQAVSVAQSTFALSALLMRVDLDGHPHLTWAYIDGSSKLIALYSRSYDGGVTFTTPIQYSVGDENTMGGIADLAIDHHGHPYILYKANASNGSLYFVRSWDNGSSFDSPRRVTLLTNTPSFYIQLNVTPSGIIHVTGNETALGAIHRRSDDGGVTFQEPTQLESTAASFTMDAKLDSQDRLHVTYGTSSARTRYRMYDGTSWSSHVNIGGTNATGTRVIGFDSSELPYILFGQNIGAVRVHFSQKQSDGTWSSGVNIDSISANATNFNTIVDNDGTIHALYRQNGGLYHNYLSGDTWLSVQKTIQTSSVSSTPFPVRGTLSGLLTTLSLRDVSGVARIAEHRWNGNSWDLQSSYLDNNPNEDVTSLNVAGW